MKKLSLFSAVLVLCLALFAGCAREGAVISSGVPESFEGFVTLVADDPATDGADVYFQLPYSDFSEGDTAYTLVQRLKEQGKICYEGSESAYGFMFTAFGWVENGEENMALREDGASHAFIALYTSVEADFGGMPMTYGPLTLETSSVGISSMHLADGAVIYITEGTW